MAELTKLGRYQLRRVLGKGAMGVVYEGFDPTLNRRVAVKTILKSVAIDAETSASYSARFVREAQAVARLNHPHIVQVHDFGEQHEVAYLVMEFIEGRELRAFFDAQEKFAPAEAVRIMGELLDALDFAHERGVIHRDVKPANVMLDAQRRVKLADFGVARIQDSDRSMAGTMVGTPAFMSPEQIQGGKVDGRTDIFSAGTILYQLLTGEQPFKGAGAWTVAKQIVEQNPPPPSTLAASLPPALDAVVHKALAKEPAERFGTAREFAAALRSALVGAQGPSSAASPKSKPKDDSRATEAEVEFWRSIQNSGDPAEFESYLQEFPQGTYAQLARIKLAKLREPLEAARKAAEEKARQEAEARAKREAEENARREAAAKTKREAEEKARRESEEKVRQAQALARRKQQEEAARPVAPAKDNDATVVVGRKRSYAIPVIVAVFVIAGAIGAYLVLGRKPAPAPVAEAPAPTPAPALVSAPSPAPKPEITAADIEKIRKETEERVRREFADKSVAEQAAAAKAASEKAIQEKQLAMKVAAEKAAADKAAADKAQAEKLAAAKSSAEKAALAKAAADKAAADKLASEKAEAAKVAAEKAAAEKIAAEKSAAAKVAAAAAKPGWPSVGDRWVYEARDADSPEKKIQVSVEVQGVTPLGMRDISRVTGGAAAVVMHQGNALLAGVAPGIASFWPYLRAFQEVRGGERWTNVEQRQLGQCSSWDCSASARIVGKEQVSVRAGSFAAWKIVVDLRMTGPAMERGSGEFTFWYSEEARRTVKYQSRFRVAGRGGVSALWAEPDIDMELISYNLAGARSAAVATEKAAAEKAPAPKEAGPSVEAQLERFIQRKGRDKIMRSEPPPDAHSPHQTPELPFGHVVYVNDGSCGPGRIKQVTGGSVPRNAPRTYRCISLTD